MFMSVQKKGGGMKVFSFLSLSLGMTDENVSRIC